ncbi:MAG: hypothetical protein U0105_18015 [Candidatus Obscuribacterales bacterium]
MEMIFQIQALERIFEKALSSMSSMIITGLTQRGDQLTFSLGLACLVVALIAPFTCVWFLYRREQARSSGRANHFVCSIANGGEQRIFSLARRYQ